MLPSGTAACGVLFNMLKILDHPLAAHIMTHLRDEKTQPITFRTLTYQISLLLAIEVTRDLALRTKSIRSPMEAVKGVVLNSSLAVVPILRAGLGMVQPFTDLFPDVSVGYVGLERDHKTAVARNYYCKLPPLEGRRVVVVDPMLATGGSAVQAIDTLKKHGAESVTLACIVSAPEGVDTVHAAHGDVRIYTAAYDRELNAQRYILPGLGDFGDRLYGT